MAVRSPPAATLCKDNDSSPKDNMPGSEIGCIFAAKETTGTNNIIKKWLIPRELSLKPRVSATE